MLRVGFGKSGFGPCCTYCLVRKRSFPKNYRLRFSLFKNDFWCISDRISDLLYFSFAELSIVRYAKADIGLSYHSFSSVFRQLFTAPLSAKRLLIRCRYSGLFPTHFDFLRDLAEYSSTNWTHKR